MAKYQSLHYFLLKKGNEAEKRGVFSHNDQDRQNLLLSHSLNYITNRLWFYEM
jgi:hypothetical protein